jgi:hypothetical protein
LQASQNQQGLHPDGPQGHAGCDNELSRGQHEAGERPAEDNDPSSPGSSEVLTGVRGSVSGHLELTGVRGSVSGHLELTGVRGSVSGHLKLTGVRGSVSGHLDKAPLETTKGHALYLPRQRTAAQQSMSSLMKLLTDSVIHLRHLRSVTWVSSCRCLSWAEWQAFQAVLLQPKTASTFSLALPYHLAPGHDLAWLQSLSHRLPDGCTVDLLGQATVRAA